MIRKSTMRGGMWGESAKTEKPKDILARVQTLEDGLSDVARDLQITREAAYRLNGEFATVKKVQKGMVGLIEDLVTSLKKIGGKTPPPPID